MPLFLAIVVCLAIWQVWLTWHLMEQDRNLAAQRSRERLEQIADLAVAQLSSVLGEWDLSLRGLDALPPPAALKAKLPLNGTLVLLAHHFVAANQDTDSAGNHCLYRVATAAASRGVWVIFQQPAGRVPWKSARMGARSSSPLANMKRAASCGH